MNLFHRYIFIFSVHRCVLLFIYIDWSESNHGTAFIHELLKTDLILFEIVECQSIFRFHDLHTLQYHMILQSLRHYIWLSASSTKR